MRLFPLLAGCLLAGCGSVSLWPFGSSSGTELSRAPANATEYKCEGGKGFYVRNIEDGAVWLIAPDREIRLAKLAAGGYGVGRVELRLDGDSATLVDPPATFKGCKRAAKSSGLEPRRARQVHPRAARGLAQGRQGSWHRAGLIGTDH